jgi:hypothetical protein
MMGYKRASGWCYDCGHYRLTELEACAVSRKLAQLDRFERELRELTAAQADTLNRFLDIDKKAGAVARELARQYQKQSCGHERRFTVTGDDGDIGEPRGTTQWCALGELCRCLGKENEVGKTVKTEYFCDNHAGCSSQLISGHGLPEGWFAVT